MLSKKTFIPLNIKCTKQKANTEIKGVKCILRTKTFKTVHLVYNSCRAVGNQGFLKQLSQSCKRGGEVSATAQLYFYFGCKLVNNTSSAEQQSLSVEKMMYHNPFQGTHQKRHYHSICEKILVFPQYTNAELLFLMRLQFLLPYKRTEF